ncbi:MAG: hypothetical protein ING69_10790 [Rhodocyclaceae bacterium]|nr:hypothetical protein [Rhodocyclaceae bacterium]
MSIVDDAGAYMTGRFAGKLAGKVEAQNELKPQIWDLEHKLINVVKAMNIEKSRADANLDTALEAIKEREKYFCILQGYVPLLNAISAESTAMADHVVKHGAISGEDLARLAPLTLERRLPYEQRVNGMRLVREAALSLLDGDRGEAIRSHYGEYAEEIISYARAEIEAW